MKYLFIGDIHGRVKTIKSVMTQFPDHNRIWVGDFVDSFEETIEDQTMCINMASCLSESDRDIVLFGNHELSYLFPHMRASGHTAAIQAIINNLKSQILESFRYYFYIPEHKVLVTHAGLTNQIYEEHKGFILSLGGIHKFLKDKDYQTQDQWWSDISQRIGTARGGLSKYGGTTWCDWKKEFEPILEINQVFGHTPIDKITRTFGSDNYNIDCLERGAQEVLELSDHGFEIISLKNA